MANIVGYEELRVTSTVLVGPTLATVRGALCAVFLVEPSGEGVVRWRAPTAPQSGFGFPLYPGKWISVVGPNNIRDSQFILEAGEPVRLHCLYFDRVDVVAADFAPPSSASAAPEHDFIGETLQEILAELKEQTELLTELT